MFFSDGRIKAFGNGIHDFNIIYRHDDCFTKVMIAFDVCRNAYLMDYIGYYNFKIGIFAVGRRGVSVTAYV